MADINRSEGYSLNLPTTYMGPNYVYAISITPSGAASLVTYNSQPEPTFHLSRAPCAGAGSFMNTVQTPFHHHRTGGDGK